MGSHSCLGTSYLSPAGEWHPFITRRSQKHDKRFILKTKLRLITILAIPCKKMMLHISPCSPL